MSSATFVLSTGRCGTQWLHEAFSGAFEGALRVEHEPLHNRYEPARMLAAGDPAALPPARAKAILAHFESVERTLDSRNYLETGHPCWSSIPAIARRLPGRVRVVHLVRHPVTMAFSWLSHGAYVPPLLPALPAKEFVTPIGDGVTFPEYRERWPELSPLEKCLYYWAEVNAFALKLEERGGFPWLRLRYEDLFGQNSDALRALLRFTELPDSAAERMAPGKSVDQFRFALAAWPEPERISRHPAVIALAERFGYRPTDYAADDLRKRFFCP